MVVTLLFNFDSRVERSPEETASSGNIIIKMLVAYEIQFIRATYEIKLRSSFTFSCGNNADEQIRDVF